MQDRLTQWLRLSLAPGLGPAGLRRLLNRFGDPAEIVAAGRTALQQAGLQAATIDALIGTGQDETIEAILEWNRTPDQGAFGLDDPRYPDLLRSIDDPPPILFYRGDPDLLSLPGLAMVGSRTPTPTGAENARAFARHLGGTGLVIASGLALGIDAASHRGALDAEALTIGVIGTGPDRVYPARNRDLAASILAAGGLLVGELPPGVGARASHFPRRNRILSGLTLGTLVVEAGLRSGSLITARCAMEQGREVFAMPGSIHNPLARGCHALIRQGAKLVETAADVLEELAPQLLERLPDRQVESTPANASPELDDDQRRLLDCMDDVPAEIDLLAGRSGFSAAEVASMLLILELRGEVRSAAGGRYLRPPASCRGAPVG